MLRNPYLALLTSAALLVSLPAIPAHAWTEKALLSLARLAVRAEVEGRTPPAPKDGSPGLPIFVTIERQGKVIGCRGALTCRSRTLEEEIVLSARAAAAHDPRYRPLTRKDLADFQVTVTLVRDLRPLESADIATLTPAEGLVLKAGSRTGVVLPYEGRDPRIRLEWAFKKAGVTSGTPCTLQRMIADRFRG
jgi:AMMECR1 domain-containing protein